ncbi:MAG TPA: methyltransferase domain-containing protein [Ktedonobacterales bacterium]|nr:methyltransferase domain-containing protein [Ktedonobacterales bacterium]
MPTKFDARKRQMLLSEEREQALKPEKLLRELGLKEGNTMADIGCGPGFFTVPAAQIVGEKGVVLAADVQGEMLSAVKSRITEKGLKNVRVVKTSDTDVPLPPESCDFVLLAFVLHEIDNRASFLHKAGRLLKKRARLAVIEWQQIAEENGPPLENRISAESVAEDAHAAGLQVVDRHELNDHHYVFILATAKA